MLFSIYDMRCLTAEGRTEGSVRHLSARPNLLHSRHTFAVFVSDVHESVLVTEQHYWPWAQRSTRTVGSKFGRHVESRPGI